jgi:glycosyltransferase involved in cell wall biosynthesis
MVKRKPRRNKTIISVIIPAYKQEKSIAKDLRRIEKVLRQLRQSFEIIVVVDGFTDKTFDNAKKVKSKYIKVVGYDKNLGKGYAIRYGIVRSKGNIVGFVDAGMDLNPNGLAMLLEHFEWYNADIIVGSKRHPVSKIHYPIKRKIISYCSQLLIRFLFGLEIRDTQVGMKFFKREVLESVMPRLIVKQYAFDIEILVVAHTLGYIRIYEAPVELNWNLGPGITVKNLWKILLLTFIDTIAIFYRLKILHYYSDRNKKQWKYDSNVSFRVNLRKV